jgi:hypothetical protein
MTVYANDNHPRRRDPSAGAGETAMLLIRRRQAASSDAIEQLADALVEGQLGQCGSPEFAIAVIDELRRMAGALRAEETGRSPSPASGARPGEPPRP